MQMNYLECIKMLVPSRITKVLDLILDIKELKDKDKVLKRTGLEVLIQDSRLFVCHNNLFIETKKLSTTIVQKGAGQFAYVFELHDSVLYFYSRDCSVLYTYRMDELRVKDFLFNLSTIHDEYRLICIALMVALHDVRPDNYLMDIEYFMEFLGEKYEIR